MSGKAMEAFVALMREGDRIRRLREMMPDLDATRAMSTPELKRLWDSYDGAETSNPAISGEAVHLVLNERGEGEYCRV